MIADEASAHLASIQEYAREAGSAVFDVLTDELLRTVELLEEHPEMGPAYPLDEGDQTRRIFLKESKHFLYYEHDAARDTVTVTAVWYAGRGVTPNARARKPRS